MPLALAKRAIDLGIVMTDGEAALRFYRDTLGFEHEGDIPHPLGGTMHRLWCGDSLIKIMVPEEEPAERAPAGGIPAATGYRYWTISVTNIEELVAACKAGGYRVRVEPTRCAPA
jgi:catechol 2,3-dioxygenase-like lactoylglutathione lyase family enzyme